MSATVTQLFDSLQAPEGLDKGIYEGYVLRSVPEVTDGDLVFAPTQSDDNVIHVKKVKSVA